MPNSPFERFIGIDYSGAKTSTSRLSAIQVYLSDGSPEPTLVSSPVSADGRTRNWCRQEVAEFLIAEARSGKMFIAGIDHGFSFPLSYFRKYGIESWSSFLDDFCALWPMTCSDVSVDSVRNRGEGPPRMGEPDELRLTEKWTSSAKSVFLFDVQGSVAKSTHAGLPWLKHIRDEAGENIHFWPFDGWRVPPGKSVIAEVYPSLVRRRYPSAERTPDQQDAYSVARWLAEACRSRTLSRYYDPPLSESERATANLEGWILGVT